MWTLTFWRAVAERALKTAAQTAIATIGTTAAFDEVDWRVIGSVVLLATIASVLTSIATAATTDGSPSLNGSEALQYEQPPTTPSGVADVKPTSVVQLENGTIETHYSDGTITTDPGIGNPPTASLS